MKTDDLINLAFEICKLNDFECAVTGSLMLCIRGTEPLKPPKDIDIICDGLYEDDINVPKGFFLNETNGWGSEIESIVYKHKETGLKIDFLWSDEYYETIDYNGLSIPCGKIKDLLDAKIWYYLNDKNPESRGKHEQDLIHLDQYLNEVQRKKKGSKFPFVDNDVDDYLK